MVERVRRIFDLGADPLQIETHLSSDSSLRTLLEMRPGLRVPGAWEGFEVAVRAILGEGLAVTDAGPLAERLVRKFGTPLTSSVEGLTHLFPRPEDLADAELVTVGIRGRKAATLQALVRAICAKELTFEASRTLEDTISRLCSIRGIEESTAHYIAMRAFGEPDAFPCGETGLHEGATDEQVTPSPVEVVRNADRWRPWRAYGAMHLWAGRRRRNAPDLVGDRSCRD